MVSLSAETVRMRICVCGISGRSRAVQAMPLMRGRRISMSTTSTCSSGSRRRASLVARMVSGAFAATCRASASPGPSPGPSPAPGPAPAPGQGLRRWSVTSALVSRTKFFYFKNDLY